jgi:myo-inositol 2-dehydrogenase / D-chiro-inositol 1-dehydrogenase
MRIGLIGVGRMGQVHAANLRAFAEVDDLLIADLDPRRAAQAGAKAVSVDELLAARPHGVVIATPTPTHAGLIAAAGSAGAAVFCEKPIALDAARTRALLARCAGARLQIGFQRRFDPGFVALRAAVKSGRLGWLHTLRACTSDAAPPHPEFLPTSGGLFRDCSVHDFDAIRWVTGREVTSVQAVGANRGAAFFFEAGDVDTCAALLTLDDGAIAVCTATRYNGAGYDVRLEACGSAGTMVAGLDERAPLEPAAGRAGLAPGPASGFASGLASPASGFASGLASGPASGFASGLASGPVSGPASGFAPMPSSLASGESVAYRGFADRFAAAYVAEMAAFLDLAAGRAPSRCSGEDALAAQLVADAAEVSRREGRAVVPDDVGVNRGS